MSRFMDEADAAYRRWRDTHQEKENLRPVVRVVLRNGESRYFNGLSVAPAGISTTTVAISSVGDDPSTLVIRDDDIQLVEIDPIGP